MVKKALTIAGTDPSGGAGIQADLKTFQELGVYGMSVITAVVSQNTLGVRSFLDMPKELIASQIEAVFSDIVPDVVKTGMLSRPETIEVVVEQCKRFSPRHIVVDPVMVAKSGDSLLTEDAKKQIVEQLLPLATVVTPNIPEAEVLTGITISNKVEMENAARMIVQEFGAKAAVVKGGHRKERAVDVLFDGKETHVLSAEKFSTKHTHGTGCTVSAALAAGLAKGMSLTEAFREAKRYITLAITQPLEIGKGNGPVNHWGHRRVP